MTSGSVGASATLTQPGRLRRRIFGGIASGWLNCICSSLGEASDPVALDWHQTLSHGDWEVPAALVDVLRSASVGSGIWQSSRSALPQVISGARALEQQLL